MLDTKLNKKWRIDFFKVFSSQTNTKEDYEKADKIKFEHFPPVIAKFHNDLENTNLEKLLQGKLTLKKAKLSKSYDEDILKINYKDTIKTQLNVLMEQQIENLKQEDPTFLKDDEKEIIEKSEFPFIKLMTLVYSKDTDEMTDEDKQVWKKQMNEFINQQIIFGVINTYFTMKLYQDNIYTTTFQTPYNKQYTWNKYANDNTGICLTYDFKEISQKNAQLLSKIYPVVYSDKKLSSEDFDYNIYNTHCASLIKIDENIADEDNTWEYITSYHYNEKEYGMLDRILEPVYEKAFSYPQIMELSKKNYLYEKDSDLEYDYDAIINDIDNILSSEEYNNQIKDSLDDVYNLTDDEIEIDFMKPEGLYLGQKFDEEKVEEYDKMAQENDVKIFRIKEGEGMLYKSLI